MDTTSQISDIDDTNKANLSDLTITGEEATGTSECSEISDSFTNDEYNRHLQTRILSLRNTIHALKTQLHDEREIWRREMEERRENDYITRATEMGYQYYGDMLSDLADTDIQFQDNRIQCHYEHRQNLQKQIAMANYKRRLLEVENMCNLELLRVKQSVQILQPLQVMCSEWKFPDEGGDSNKDCANKDCKDATDEEKLKNNCKPSEVSMPLEVIAQKFETTPLEVSKSQPNLTEDASG